MIFRPLLVAAGLAVCGAASAQNAPAAQTGARPPAQQGQAATRPAPKPATRPAAAKPAALPEASADQLAASQLAHYGEYQCEFDQKLTVGIHKATGGYVDVVFKGRTYVMKPVLSSTGALRLEDVTGRTLMIQIASKSMLMDTKAGQRLVDECVHPQQVQTAQTATPAAPILSN